jgi:lysylphosphatidylglycerol synthetase-like protein (DUF2156 family)
VANCFGRRTVAYSCALVDTLVRAGFPGAFSPDSAEHQSLRDQYGSLEFASQITAIIAVVVSIVLLIVLHVGNTSWLVGVAFGWLVLTPVLLIALFTLPRGLKHWRDFWRFYELQYRTSLRFIAPLYICLSLLGIVSTAVLLLRR